MKIAVLTSGILPVPAVKGGAVENLIDFYLEYNEQKKLHDITIYSVADNGTAYHHALKSSVNHYHYIDIASPFAKIQKRFYYYLHKHKEYYDNNIEYFLDKAIRHIRRQDFDIIILENRPGYVLRLKDITKAKIVFHLHNNILSTKTPNNLEIYNTATQIITVSDYIKSCVLTINKNDTKTITVHNAIDVKRFSIRTNSPITRSSIGFAEDDIVIVYSGRVNKDKGVSELIDAILLIKDAPKLKLMIIGGTFYGNTNQDDEFISILKKKAQKIRDKIVFTGFVPYKEIPNYLQMADFAVLPSMWDEPFGLTIAEAMAAGLPVITTRSGGIPELCEGVATIVEREDITKNLAAAIHDLYHNPEKRNKMAKAIVERAKLFDKEEYVKKIFAALESI